MSRQSRKGIKTIHLYRDWKSDREMGGWGTKFRCPHYTQELTKRNVLMNRPLFCAMTSSALLALHLRMILSSVLAEQSAPSKLSLVQRAFGLQSPMGNPFFSWPRTLLSYAVKSSDESPDLSRYKLLCIETGEVVPFQVSKSPKPSNGKDSQAQFLFCSDLPSASTRTYRLTPTTSDTIESSQNQIKITHEEHRLMIDTGPMQIRIPASQDITSGAPGPIMEVARGGRWTWLSTLKITHHPIASILTEDLQPRPLRSSHRITYTTHSRFQYVATIECMAGVDFVRLHENMETNPCGVYADFDFAWSNYDFAYRKSPNHPYHFPSTAKTEYTDYPWRSEEHTSELQSHLNLLCRLLLEKKKDRPTFHVYLPHPCLSLDVFTSLQVRRERRTHVHSRGRTDTHRLNEADSDSAGLQT